jgi:hypothetical protein
MYDSRDPVINVRSYKKLENTRINYTMNLESKRQINSIIFL